MTNILNNMSFQELLNQMVLTHKFYLEHQISITNANSNYNFFKDLSDVEERKKNSKTKFRRETAFDFFIF